MDSDRRMKRLQNPFLGYFRKKLCNNNLSSDCTRIKLVNIFTQVIAIEGMKNVDFILRTQKYINVHQYYEKY